MGNFICKYCGKECKNKNSLTQHEIRCKENPDRIKVISNFIKYNEEIEQGIKNHWCKGLTKENSDIIKNRTNTLVENYKNGINVSWCKGLSKETDERVKKYSNSLSNTVSDKVINNNWHTCRSKKYYYNNISFDSIWEIYFYKYIKSLNIEIFRCKDKFQYEYKNGIHKYIPDFYIPKYDLYIEIKGYSTNKDIAKWNQFNKKLNIYFGHNLKNLGISEFLNFKDSNDRIIKYENSVPNKFKQRIII